MVVWDILLSVEEIANTSFFVLYYENTATGLYRWYILSLYFGLMTKSLNSGTYLIKTYWKCAGGAIGVNELYFQKI